MNADEKIRSELAHQCARVALFYNDRKTTRVPASDRLSHLIQIKDASAIVWHSAGAYPSSKGRMLRCIAFGLQLR
jgi:hypothetical protein